MDGQGNEPTYDRRHNDSLVAELADAIRKNGRDHWDMSSWFRYAVGGLVAGLVAWGGISGRVTSLEVRLIDADGRASEDRATLNRSVQDLTSQIHELSKELTVEREERIQSGVRRREDPTTPVFKYPK